MSSRGQTHPCEEVSAPAVGWLRQSGPQDLKYPYGTRAGAESKKNPGISACERSRISDRSSGLAWFTRGRLSEQLNYFCKCPDRGLPSVRSLDWLTWLSHRSEPIKNQA